MWLSVWRSHLSLYNFFSVLFSFSLSENRINIYLRFFNATQMALNLGWHLIFGWSYVHVADGTMNRFVAESSREWNNHKTEHEKRKIEQRQQQQQQQSSYSEHHRQHLCEFWIATRTNVVTDMVSTLATPSTTTSGTTPITGPGNVFKQKQKFIYLFNHTSAFRNAYIFIIIDGHAEFE